mgnify:CR=1
MNYKVIQPDHSTKSKEYKTDRYKSPAFKHAAVYERAVIRYVGILDNPFYF